MIVFGRNPSDRRMNAVRTAMGNAAYFNVEYVIFTDACSNMRLERVSSFSKGARALEKGIIVKPGDTIDQFQTWIDGPKVKGKGTRRARAR